LLFLVLLITGSFLSSFTTSLNAQGTKPNVVVIMTDDVGWGDLGSYGGGAMRGAPTTNLDRMAAEGMRFVNYYGQASCTAGRASFITGRVTCFLHSKAILFLCTGLYKMGCPFL
jgi:arylsulfatase